LTLRGTPRILAPMLPGSPGGRPDERVSRKHAWILFALALGVRALLLPWAADLPLAGDEAYYWGYSGLLASGNVDDFVLRPPMWGALVGVARAIHDDPFAARVLATLLGAATPPLLYLLGARVFGHRTGLVAGLILVFYPEHLGYSHYLWAECFFGLQAVLVTWLFFRFLEDGRTAPLVLFAVAAGVAVLTKVFAVVLFGAAVLTLIVHRAQRPERRLQKIALAGLIFLAPVTIYSVFASNLAGRRVVLSETGMLSMRQATGLDPGPGLDYRPHLRDELTAELIAHLRQRPLSQAYGDVRRQIQNLWTPNSWVSHRLIGEEKDASRWRYDVPRALGLPLTLVVTGAYLAVVILGLAGLCLADASPFKTFSAIALLGLCATAGIAFLASRYRFSFTFLFVLHAAHLVTNPRAVFAGLRSPWRAVSLLVLLAFLAHVVLLKQGTIGGWG